MIVNPVVLEKEIGGVCTKVAFEREFVESWLADNSDIKLELTDFLLEYTSDWVESLEDEWRRKNSLFLSDSVVEVLWDNMSNMLFDEAEDGEMKLASSYHIFAEGTARTEIWHWFDTNYSKGIMELLYGDSNKRVKL
ncbi:hypothetical protein R6Z02_14940 [Carnobacterium maltaromaticum]|uniref:hypothetical protein n=1 Tax=Carnobacterium maltaromaticum TaxID=2751 RepID=UPI00298B6F63|nr:hypothetical protein [Carnobacterium maltaromaticum]MDW5525050.1 hypothetical protein [Carnobacterium maltaromaticum]